MSSLVPKSKSFQTSIRTNNLNLPELNTLQKINNILKCGPFAQKEYGGHRTLNLNIIVCIATKKKKSQKHCFTLPITNWDKWECALRLFSFMMLGCT